MKTDFSSNLNAYLLILILTLIYCLSACAWTFLCETLTLNDEIENLSDETCDVDVTGCRSCSEIVTGCEVSGAVSLRRRRRRSGWCRLHDGCPRSLRRLHDGLMPHSPETFDPSGSFCGPCLTALPWAE